MMPGSTPPEPFNIHHDAVALQWCPVCGLVIESDAIAPTMNCWGVPMMRTIVARVNHGPTGEGHRDRYLAWVKSLPLPRVCQGFLDGLDDNVPDFDAQDAERKRLHMESGTIRTFAAMRGALERYTEAEMDVLRFYSSFLSGLSLDDLVRPV